MKASFIVTLDLDALDPTFLAQVAEDVLDELSGSFEVIDVKPWSRHDSGPNDISAALPLPF